LKPCARRAAGGAAFEGERHSLYSEACSRSTRSSGTWTRLVIGAALMAQFQRLYRKRDECIEQHVGLHREMAAALEKLPQIKLT